MSADAQKKRAAEAALVHVKDGMLLGLGTGSTAACFVRALGARVRDGLRVKAVPTSHETRDLALQCGIELFDPDETTVFDLVIDGADECDPALALIKGGGGALLREKIIATASRKMIVIADAGKYVRRLGQFPLPVEIDRFAWPLTLARIKNACTEAGLGKPPMRLRAGPRAAGGGVFRSDGGHYIIDISCGAIPDARQLDRALHAIPGVIETGLFLDLATIAIFGSEDGVDIRERSQKNEQ